MDDNRLSKRCAVAIRIEASNKGIDIYDVEKAAGLSKGYISRCKNGNRRFSIDSIYVIGKFLGKDFFEVYKEEQEQ